MDSGSDKTGNKPAAKRLLKTLSCVLASGGINGLQTTCDIHVRDGAGKLVARRRLQAYWDYTGTFVVSEVSPARGQAPAASETGLGDPSVSASVSSSGAHNE